MFRNSGLSYAKTSDVTMVRWRVSINPGEVVAAVLKRYSAIWNSMNKRALDQRRPMITSSKCSLYWSSRSSGQNCFADARMFELKFRGEHNRCEEAEQRSSSIISFIEWLKACTASDFEHRPAQMSKEGCYDSPRVTAWTHLVIRESKWISSCLVLR
jgi:hypothetical protein